MQTYAKKYQMAMVVPVYEREQAGVYYNTAAVIDADGTYLGKYRKNHIPHTNGFWEKFFFKPGNLGYPTFQTRYAKIGVYICYDRHFPEGARLLGLNGAEIVFNPSATVAGLSQYLWKLEQPAHAVANGYFVAASNRVGTEAPWNIGKFYGTSYLVDPRGNFVATGSEDKDELVVGVADLELIEETRRTWQFYRDRRPETYGDMVEQLPVSTPDFFRKTRTPGCRPPRRCAPSTRSSSSPRVANYYEESVVLESGKGSRLKDLDGKTYLDFFGGILTVSLGQANERVNAALHAQIDRLGHVSTLYPTLPIVELAEKLVATAPGKLEKAFFTASGTEADETAVALAQMYTGRQEIVALRHGYSGRSLLAQSLTAHARYRNTTTQIAAIKHAHAPYCYRCPFDATPDHCGLKCATDIEELIQTTTTGEIAGFLAEPIQGVGGFIDAPNGYFKTAVDIVRKYGGVFICDEVQTGFGRTGGKMWGIQHHEGVDPDIMTMAKGIANGLPLSATLATTPIADSWKGGNISTFGGNPISATAGIAVLDAIAEENLIDNCREDGEAAARRARRAAEEVPQDHRRRPRQGADAGARAGSRRDHQGPHARSGSGQPALRGDQEAGSAHRQGRPVQQRHPHRPGAEHDEERHRGGPRRSRSRLRRVRLLS